MALRGPARVETQRIPYAPLKKLVEPGEDDLSVGFERLAERLKASGEAVDIQFDIADGRGTQQWHLALRQKSATVSNDAVRRPDVHFIVGRETWQRIMEGELSPLDAFLSGQLRFRGDLETATRLYKKIAGRGVTEIPLSRRG